MKLIRRSVSSTNEIENGTDKEVCGGITEQKPLRIDAVLSITKKWNTGLSENEIRKMFEDIMKMNPLKSQTLLCNFFKQFFEFYFLSLGTSNGNKLNNLKVSK